MALYQLPNLTSGIDEAILSTARSVPAFPIGLLLFVYIVVLLGGTTSQSRRYGYADYPFWNLMASISCTMLSLIMTIKIGLITLDVLGVVVAITIISGLWFFLSKGRNEIQ